MAAVGFGVVVAVTGIVFSTARAVVTKVLAVVATTVGFIELVWGLCVVACDTSTDLTVEPTIALAVVADIDAIINATTCSYTL